MKRFVLISISILLLGCSVSRATLAKVDCEVVGFDKNVEWRLVKINSQELDGLSAVTIRLNPETLKFSCFTGCNNVYGGYDANLALDNTGGYSSYVFSFSDLLRQKTQCTDAQMKIEGKILAALSKVTDCRISAYELVFYQKDKELLRFER